MLTTTQIDHYRTFGFVVLRSFLAPHTEPLHLEVSVALRDAYADTYDERVVDGISGHYLPMASARTPRSAALVCDDPRFIVAAAQLLGGPVIPECPEGVLYFHEAGWHRDDGIGVRGVTFAAYFEPLDAATGALRLLPGSHHPEYQARLVEYRGRQRNAHSDDRTGVRVVGYPGYVAETRPGDVVAFDLHTWHASFGGCDRLAWTIAYQRRPRTDEDRRRTLRSMTDCFEQAFRGFDRNRYPVWRDWLAESESRPRRATVARYLRTDGVLDLPGAELGW